MRNMPVVGIFGAYARKVRPGALRSPLERVVVHAFGRQGIMAIAFDLIAQRPDHLRTNRAVGVPYSDDQIANAVADLKAQADPDSAGADGFAKRYPKAVARNFDGKAGAPTEMDALVAYLQMLGTLVDFKLYNEKANLR